MLMAAAAATLTGGPFGGGESSSMPCPLPQQSLGPFATVELNTRAAILCAVRKLVDVIHAARCSALPGSR
jgi:hypothetical protein